MRKWLVLWLAFGAAFVIFLNRDLISAGVYGAIATLVIAVLLSVLRGRGRGRRRRKSADDGPPDERPALIYIITYGSAIKVGIGDDSFRRIDDHKSEGWRIDHVYTRNGSGEVLTREEARRIERVVLSDWRRRRLPQGMRQEDMPQGGYTETTLQKHVSVDELREVVESELGIVHRRRLWFRRRA